MNTAVGAAVRGFLQERLGILPESLRDDLRLDRVGLDSIEIPGLLHHVQEVAGIELELGDVLQARTLGELCARASGPQGRESGADFAEHVNPELARLLRHLHLDRSYVRGEGLVLHDAQAREVLDFTSQFGALPFGYNPPELWRALLDCRDRAVPSFVQPSLLGPAAALAARLLRCAPRGLSRVTFANSGAEAVEVAIKLAFARTGRRGIVSTQGGFHGKTLGALSATGRREYQLPFGLPLPGFATIPYDEPEALQQLLAAEPERYAAFLVEPIQGEAGVIVPRPEYLQRVQEICRRHGVLLAVDEVQTGLGRTGSMFATPPEVEPDLLMVAKALGGGLVPMAACLCRGDVFTRDFAAKHSSTFAGHGLGAAVGLEVLALLGDPAADRLGHVARMGARLREGLEAAAARHPELVAAVRGRGLLLGVELHQLRRASSGSLLGVLAEQERLAAVFAAYLLNVHGVRAAHSLNHGNVLRVQPALNVSAAQCERFLAAFDATLAVFASGSIARVYAGLHGTLLPPDGRASLARRRPLQQPRAAPAFALLYHPPDASSFAQLDPSFGALPDALRPAFARDAAELVDPFVAARSRFVSSAGACAEGVFVLAPHTAEELLALRADGKRRLFDAYLAAARAHGAGVLGLAGYTSIISQGGRGLTGQGFAVTSGNSLTAVASLRTLARECTARGRSWPDARLAIVGAGGSIGRALALLAAREAGALLCLGNAASGARGRERLERVANELCARLLDWAEDPTIQGGSLLACVRELQPRANRDPEPARWLRAALASEALLRVSVQLEELAGERCVVAAVSSPKPCVHAAQLCRDALFCDVSRPRALSASTIAQRRDVRVVDAGHVALPHATDVAPLGLPPGQLYACMAETLLLAWEGVARDYSLGADLALEDLLELERWANKHGLRFV